LDLESGIFFYLGFPFLSDGDGRLGSLFAGGSSRFGGSGFGSLL
jgi:hypothetical protein